MIHDLIQFTIIYHYNVTSCLSRNTIGFFFIHCYFQFIVNNRISIFRNIVIKWGNYIIILNITINDSVISYPFIYSNPSPKLKIYFRIVFLNLLEGTQTIFVVLFN